MKIPNATTQWVMIVPDDLTKINDDGCCFYKMPHPDTESPSLFLFKEKKVYQVMKCDESYRSWFIDETVQKDGSFCMITPVDPLFLALPYLEKFAMENKFSTLDNILIDENYQQALTKLEDCLTKQNLLNICICKGSDDIVAYKSDESKILAWLSLKVSKLSEHLSTSNINVGQGAKVSNFGQVYRDAKLKEEDCNRYAWTVISEYIPNDWVDKLKENMNIKDTVVQQPVKKQKLNDSTAADSTLDVKGTGEIEDYRDHSKAKKTKAPPKLTQAQKQLQKVDKKGMKTMSSFFTSKPKK